MLEVGAAVTECNFCGHTDLLGYLGLERGGILHFGLLAVFHVEQCGTGQFCRHEALVELAAVGQFLHQRIGNSLACLVMLGITLYHLGLERPVLVDLRTHLDIVAVNVRTGKSLVRSARQHSLKRVAELMERCLDLVDGQQRWRRGGGLREVAYIIYYRTAHLAVGIYSCGLHLLHPRALALGVAGEIVAHPHGNVLAGLGVDHVIYLHVLHIFGSVRHRHKLDAVQFLGGIEQALQHLVHAQIGTKVGLVEVILLLLHLVGIVIIVPGGDGDVVAMLVSVGLHVLHLLVRALHGRLEHLHQQVGGVFGSLGHHSRRHHACEVLETHDVGLLVAQLHYLGDDGHIGVVAIRSQAGVALVHGG